MNNKNWHAVDIDISNAINPQFKFEDLLVNATYVDKTGTGVWGYDGTTLTNFFTKEWLTYMQSLDIDVLAVLIFFRRPYYVFLTPHIDLLYGQENHPSIALNWIVGNNDDSYMVWYKTPLDAAQRPHEVVSSGQGHEYIAWPYEDLVEIERHTIGNQPTVVRTDIPHGIIVNASPRWSISVRCKLPGTTKTHVTWEQIVDYIQPHIKKFNANNIK